MEAPVVAADTPMADVNAWGWQGSSKTIKERTAYMLNHSPIPFNIQFRVCLPGKRAFNIEAHKDVLAMGSEVFLAMFYGGLATNDKVIDIPDTDPRAFRLMIRYLYTEEMSTASTGMDIALLFEVMKCAGKYGVPYLYIYCRQRLLQHFVEYFKDKENVKAYALLYLQLAVKVEYEDRKIQEALWSEIDVCAESVLLTPDDILRNVSLDTLTIFLARDSLTVLKEKHIYDFMIRWAKLREPDVTAGPIVRERLGDAFSNIRYTQMSLSELSNGPVADNLLTSDEAVQVYRHQFAPVAEDIFPFISRERKRTPPPTMLCTELRCFNGGPLLESIGTFSPFAIFTIQMAELDPVLMEYLQRFVDYELLKSTWSCAEKSSSTFSILTAHFGDAFNEELDGAMHFDDDEVKLLKEKAGQVVKLGFGDVAMEVAFTEIDDPRSHHQTETISLIFGGYTNSAYTSVAKANSVFFLGRIVSGPADFSFLRHVVQPGKLLPVEADLSFSVKYK